MELATTKVILKSKQKYITGLALTIERLSIIDDSQHHEFHTVSECGSLIDIMKSIIDKQDIDIVIMGTKGDIDFRTQIYGSQTLLVMKKLETVPF